MDFCLGEDKTVPASFVSLPVHTWIGRLKYTKLEFENFQEADLISFFEYLFRVEISGCRIKRYVVSVNDIKNCEIPFINLYVLGMSQAQPYAQSK